MIRLRSSLVIVAVLTTISASAATALAAGTGALTSVEYQQLQAAQTRLKHVGTKLNLRDAQAALFACQQIQMETPLLDQVRAWCDSGEQILIFNLSAKQSVTPCESEVTPAARISCVVKWYGKFDSELDANFQASEKIASIASARALGAACTAFLAGSPATIADTGGEYRAIKAAIVALRAGNKTLFEADDTAATSLSTRLEKDENANHTQLSSCLAPASERPQPTPVGE